MNQRHCPRMWEADAREDGQLVGADKESFDRHLLTCSICQQEVEAHATVLAIMRGVRGPAVAPLAHRRSRIQLLDRASEESNRAERTAGKRWTAVAATTAICIVAIAIVWTFAPWASAPTQTAVAFSKSAPEFDVANIDRAVWTSHSEGGVARPLLKDGVAAFHVAHMTKGQQFVLELPDGELEVRGTRFIVRVHDGRTESVQVTEGFVALRIQGDAERLLHAGDDWSRSRDRPAAITEPLMHGTEVIPTAAAPFAAPSLSIKSSSSLQPAAAPGTPTRSGGATTVSPLPISPAGSSQPVRPVSASVASESYAAAADAFRTEAYPKADALLAAFCRDFASDPRCEDAAFLRAVAHARMGDHPGAASLARAYLQSFPNGLRRREAEALAGDGGNSSRSNAGATP